MMHPRLIMSHTKEPVLESGKTQGNMAPKPVERQKVAEAGMGESLPARWAKIAAVVTIYW